MATSFVFILNCRRHGHAFSLPGYCIREIHGCPEKSASKRRQTCSLFDREKGFTGGAVSAPRSCRARAGGESGMHCRTARTKASLVQREVARLSGPRRSPASAGSLGRGGAAERLRFPPPRRKQRMRSLRRRGGGIDAGQYPFALHFSTNQQPTVGNRSSNSTPAGGTIFLLVKKDSGERHAKGPAGPIGSPG